MGWFKGRLAQTWLPKGTRYPTENTSGFTLPSHSALVHILLSGRGVNCIVTRVTSYQHVSTSDLLVEKWQEQLLHVKLLCATLFNKFPFRILSHCPPSSILTPRTPKLSIDL